MQKHLRGQIWWEKISIELPEGIQHSNRPVLIISNNINNRFAPMVIVAPITSQTKTFIPEHIRFVNYEKTTCTILLEQIRTVPKTVLTNYMGTLEDNIMAEVDKGILASFGLSNEPLNYTEKVIEEEPIEEVVEEEPVEEVVEEEPRIVEPVKKGYKKRWSNKEKQMVWGYLQHHTIIETTKFFLDKFDMSFSALYQRVLKLNKSIKVGNTNINKEEK